MEHRAGGAEASRAVGDGGTKDWVRFPRAGTAILAVGGNRPLG